MSGSNFHNDSVARPLTIINTTDRDRGAGSNSPLRNSNLHVKGSKNHNIKSQKPERLRIKNSKAKKPRTNLKTQGSFNFMEDLDAEHMGHGGRLFA